MVRQASPPIRSATSSFPARSSGQRAAQVTYDYDAFLRNYRADGTLAWEHKIGTDEYQWSTGVSADGEGNAYITGLVEGGDLGGPFLGGLYDTFVSKHDADGNQVWVRQFGTTRGDVGEDIEVDRLGNVFVTGWTQGNLGGTNRTADVFLSKYTADGAAVWTRQLSSRGSDYGYGVAADGLGSVYIVGTTEGDLGGRNAGEDDAFVSKYDAGGIELWTRQRHPRERRGFGRGGRRGR